MQIDFRPVAELVVLGQSGTALLDTGCLCRDVMDVNFYEKLVKEREDLVPKLEASSVHIKLADKSAAAIQGTVTLVCTLAYHNNRVEITRSFLVMPCAYNIIIGLKTLCSDQVFPFFMKVLHQCRLAVAAAPSLLAIQELRTHSHNEIYKDLRGTHVKVVNQVFAENNAWGKYNVEIVEAMGSWGIKAKKYIKDGDLICQFSDQNFKTEKDKYNRSYAIDLQGRIYDAPEPGTYYYGPLANDKLSDTGNNAKAMVHRVDGKVYLRATRGIQPQEDVCIAYGKQAWVSTLELLQPGMPREQFKNLRERVQEYYGPSLRLNSVEFAPVEGELYPPFLTQPGECPEDDMIKDLELFPMDVLSIFNEQYPDRLTEYLDTLTQYIGETTLKTCPELVEFLKLDWVIKVFVQDDWTGIKHPDTGKEWVQEIEWIGQPPRRKARVVPVRPSQIEAVTKEFEGLIDIGFYVRDDADSASALVIAPKATAPFIRCCANYRPLCPYMAIPKTPLPHVRNSLNFIKDGINGVPFKVFYDLDMTAGFHQVLIDYASSRQLGVVAQNAQVRPVFLPEGIAPATAILQNVVMTVFKSCQHFMLIIYDNFLVCGTDHKNAMDNFKTMIAQAAKCNVRLKLKKCRLGVEEVQFFGYKCSADGYSLDEKRIFDTQAIPFPGDPIEDKPTKKQQRMQSYLGVGVFFSPFVPDYARRTAHLSDMTKNEFNWDEKTWRVDYRHAFKLHKEALRNTLKLFYPDYDLPFDLEADSADNGMGSLLYQTAMVGDPPVEQLQPLGMVTHKFSGAARDWHIQDKECFAITHSINKLQYILRGKHVTVHTDARNLRYMESSLNKRVYRMYLSLVNQPMTIKHIPGHWNDVADWISRLYVGQPPATIEAARQTLLAHLGEEEYMSLILCHFKEVHNGRAGHHGLYRTWMLMNKIFPDHKYTMQDIRKAIEDCVVCQKLRADRDVSLKPLVKTLRSEHMRNKLCIDYVSITKGQHGYCGAQTLSNPFTKFLHLFAVKDQTTRATTVCVIKYFSMYGMHDILHSDPGSDLTSRELKAAVEDWLGITRTFTLTNNPQADGVEPAIKKVIRHLTALLMDERLHSAWDTDAGLFLALVQLVCNETIPYDTGVSPFEATYGYIDSERYKIPEVVRNCCDNAYVLGVSSQLTQIRQSSYDYQEKQRQKRQSPPDFIQRRYRPTDYVLVIRDKWTKADKLTPRGEGPYEVIIHPLGSNHVKVKSLHNSAEFTFDCKDLKIFAGSPEDAKAMARIDKQQHVLTAVIGHTGDVRVRTQMEFRMVFEDGDRTWQLYNRDISTTAAFAAYCDTSRELQLLHLTTVQALAQQTTHRNQPILARLVGTQCYINLRYWGAPWYDQLTLLPQHLTKAYYVLAEYGQLEGRGDKVIQLDIPIYKLHYKVKSEFVYYHGYRTELPEDSELISNPELLTQYGV
jgi:hypothetical protein